MKIAIIAFMLCQFIGNLLAIASEGDIIVPVPPGLQKKGFLQVIGEIGAGQSKSFKLLKCEPDVHGQVGGKFSCIEQLHKGKYGYFTNEYHNINKDKDTEPLSLTPGYYYISYSNMHSSIYEIEEGKTTYITFRKLSVPKIDGSFSFEVYLDLTDSHEQEKLIKSWWMSKYLLWNAKNECQKPTKLCEAVKTGTYSTLKKLFTFNQEGEVRLPSFYYDKTSSTRVSITDPADGDFVSVLPGTYIIRFANSQGIYEDIYSQKVY